MKTMNKNLKGKVYPISTLVGDFTIEASGKVLDQINNVLLVEVKKASNTGSEYREYCLYNLYKSADGTETLIPTNDTYGDKETAVAPYDVVKARFDKIVEVTLEKEATDKRRAIEQAEQDKLNLLRDKAILSRANKLSEAHTLKYDAIGELRKMFADAKTVEALLKDKKAVKLLSDVLMLSVITNKFNTQL